VRSETHASYPKNRLLNDATRGLGGVESKNRVLGALLHPLTHYHKFYVLRYNGRGVGLSSGWKSFTGLQEADDLRELVKSALKRLGDDVREVALIVSVPSPFFLTLFGATETLTLLLQLSPLRQTGILEWRTDRVDALCATDAHTHHTHPDILPARAARTSHRVSDTNVSARPRGSRAATRGPHIVMPRRCG
jgi:hypothetical protein